MKVWRSGQRFFVECEKCTSQGTVHVPTFVRRTPEIDQAIADHKTKVMGYRAKCTADLNHIVHDTQAKIQSARSKEEQAKIRMEGTSRIKARYQDHVTAVLAAEVAAPKFEADEVMVDCPWKCGNKGEVKVLLLPDGVSDPWTPVKGGQVK